MLINRARLSIELENASYYWSVYSVIDWEFVLEIPLNWSNNMEGEEDKAKQGKAYKRTLSSGILFGT